MTLDADQVVAKVEHAGKTYTSAARLCKRFVAEPGKYVGRASQESGGHH
jgi:hypothetical protein